MRILYIFIIAFLSFSESIWCQTNHQILQGHVYLSELNIPLPDTEVRVITGLGQTLALDTTDATGHYQIDIPIPDEQSDSLIVSVADPCNGMIISKEFVYMAGETLEIDLVVCSVDPPNCSADFTFVNGPDLDVQFFSFSLFQPISQWQWDFGDGTTGSGPSPRHQYAVEGSYKVTLEILTADSCHDAISKEITVEPFVCDCPEYAFPVCVETADGQIKTFDNPCFAACAGYNIVISCDLSCDCPDTLDPVCVGAFDTQITYKNACHAACDGFDSFIQCDTPCICPAIYDPVCVVSTTGDLLRFSNACEAECAGYFDYSSCDSCDCPFYFVQEPVCAFGDDGSLHYFENPCEAECAGFFDYYFCDTTCGCEMNLDPVCVYIIEGKLRFLNSCHASCLGYPDAFECDSCNCPPIYEPVCVPTSTGDTLRFQSPCHAECAGFDAFLPCDTSCICTEEYDPVCVILDDGTLKEFTNSCYAECAGYFDYFSCQDSCECPRIFDPVCVLSGGGEIIQFSNACLATCAGYDVFVPCENDCACDGIVDPVCVIANDGQVIRFLSACEAICNGYHVFYNCDILCPCPAIFDPVCISLDDGTMLTFENACQAECMGYPDHQTCDSMETPDIISHNRNNIKETHSLNTFPNPFDDIIGISASVPKSGRYQIKVMNLQGYTVWEEPVHSTGSTLSVEVFVGDLPGGMYILSLESSGHRDVTRILKK